LTFKEALERLNKNLFDALPIRDPKTGLNSGVKLGSWGAFATVSIHTETRRSAKFWDQKQQQWVKFDLTDVKDPDERKYPDPIKNQKYYRSINVGDDYSAHVLASDTEHLVRVFPRFYTYLPGSTEYENAKFSLPPGGRLGDAANDFGLRFIDLDGDGRDDVV